MVTFIYLGAQSELNWMPCVFLRCSVEILNEIWFLLHNPALFIICLAAAEIVYQKEWRLVYL